MTFTFENLFIGFFSPYTRSEMTPDYKFLNLCLNDLSSVRMSYVSLEPTMIVYTVEILLIFFCKERALWNVGGNPLTVLSN